MATELVSAIDEVTIIARNWKTSYRMNAEMSLSQVSTLWDSPDSSQTAGVSATRALSAHVSTGGMQRFVTDKNSAANH